MSGVLPGGARAGLVQAHPAAGRSQVHANNNQESSQPTPPAGGPCNGRWVLTLNLSDLACASSPLRGPPAAPPAPPPHPPPPTPALLRHVSRPQAGGQDLSPDVNSAMHSFPRGRGPSIRPSSPPPPPAHRCPCPHPAARSRAQLPCASPSEEQIVTNPGNQSSNVCGPEAEDSGRQAGLPAPAPPPHVHLLNPRPSSRQPRRKYSLRGQAAVSPAREGYLGEGAP